MKVGMKAMQNHDEAGAASFDFLMYSGYVVLGYFHLKMALEAEELIQSKGTEGQPFSDEFLKQKIQLAKFYMARVLTRTASHRESMLADITSLDPVW